MPYIISAILLLIFTLLFATVIVLVRKKPKVNEILSAFEMAVSSVCLIVVLIGVFMNR